MSDTASGGAVQVPDSTLVDYFFDTVDRIPGQVVYSPPNRDPAKTFTYAQVEKEVGRGVLALIRSGVKRGDRVALISENRVEWALVDWMCQCRGAVNVPLYPTLTAQQMAYILRDSGSSLIFVSNAEMIGKAREAAEDLGGEVEVVAFDSPGDDGDAVGWDAFLTRGEGYGRGGAGASNAQDDRAPGGGPGVGSQGSGGDDQKENDDNEGLGGEGGERSGADGDDTTFDLRAEARKVRPEDVATMIYTSGTTGTPKGVMLTHRNLAANIWQCSHVLEVEDNDVTVSFLPLSHVLQRMVDYLFFCSGCRIAHSTIDEVAADMKLVRPTLVVSVPRLYEKVYQKVMDGSGLKGKLVSWAVGVGRRVAMLREENKRPSGFLGFKYALADKLVFSKVREGVGGRLRYFVSGGAALSPEINRFFLGAGIVILEGYGLTETSPVTHVNGVKNRRIGTVGPAVPGTEVRIAEDGEILIRGPQVMKGYFGMEEATREAISQDGWFKTGDIGTVSDDGFLTITDRKKDLIKTSGGKFVAPQVIENLLKKNPLIDQAVVTGEGQKFVAVLVVPAFDRLAAEAGGSADDPRGLLSDNGTVKLLEEGIMEDLAELAPFERPKKIGLIAEPFTIEDGSLTPTQKVKRNVVNERYAGLIADFYRPESVDRTVFVAAE